MRRWRRPAGGAYGRRRAGRDGRPVSAVSRPVDTPRWIGTGTGRSRILWRRRLRQALGPLSLGLLTLLFCWKLVFGGLVVIGYDTMTYMYPYRFFAAAA